MSKTVKRGENGSDIDENGQNVWKNDKNNYFWIFSEKYEKMSKKVENDQNGSVRYWSKRLKEMKNK